MQASAAPSTAPPAGTPGLVVRPCSVARGVCVVTLSGEIDLASAPKLKSALNELADAGDRQFVIDLSAVRHLDSTGLGVLVGFQNRLEGKGMLALAAAPAHVARVFEVAGVSARFHRFSSVGEAVARVRETPLRADQPRLTSDAALAVGLTLTALPFTDSRIAEADCWLRVLSLHGDGMSILCGRGPGDSPPARREDRRADGSEGHEQRARRVVARAAQLASDRGAEAVAAVDVLAAVMAVYGEHFDRALCAYGHDRATLSERLGLSAPAV